MDVPRGCREVAVRILRRYREVPRGCCEEAVGMPEEGREWLVTKIIKSL